MSLLPFYLMNNGKVIDTFLTHNESFKNMDDFTLLLICGLYFDIHNNPMMLM